MTGNRKALWAAVLSIMFGLTACGKKEKIADSTCPSEKGMWKQACSTVSTGAISYRKWLYLSDGKYYEVKKTFGSGDCTGVVTNLSVSEGTYVAAAPSEGCDSDVELTITTGSTTGKRYTSIWLNSEGLKIAECHNATGATPEQRCGNLSGLYAKSDLPATFPSCSTTPPGTITAMEVGAANVCFLIGGAVYCINASLQVPHVAEGFASGVSAITMTASGLAEDMLCGVVNGTLKCKGTNASGRIGSGNADTAAIASTPVEVTGLSSVRAIGANYAHACAAVGIGVQCWGNNFSKQVKDDSTTSFASPTLSSLQAEQWDLLALGYNHSCAAKSTGAVCWGYNSDGQLGASSNGEAVTVSGLSGTLTALAAGDNHTCAIAGGGLKCWGDNDYGQIGDGTQNAALAATQVSGLTSGVTAVAGGYSFTCAIVGGAVKCWGNNEYNQLGDGTTTSRATPVEVTGLSTGATLIDAGTSKACALVDGKLKCWGSKAAGQFSGTSNTSTPVDLTWCSMP